MCLTFNRKPPGRLGACRQVMSRQVSTLSPDSAGYYSVDASGLAFVVTCSHGHGSGAVFFLIGAPADTPGPLWSWKISGFNPESCGESFQVVSAVKF